MFDRSLWAEHYTSTPNWPCPRCSVGQLQPLQDSLMNEETEWSAQAHSHEAWEPDWIVNRYSLHLKCSDSQCGERAVIVGTAKCDLDYDYDYDGSTTTTVVNIFYPELIHPSPSLITMVDETPVEVSEEIQRASSLIWMDTSSSANKLRLAAERLLTSLKVKRTRISGGKRRPLMLNDRIALLEPKHAEIAELLHSIRFLGNHGSHESALSVDRNDLLNAFEIMEHIIELAFSKKAKRVRAAAQDINKRKGRPKAKKGKSSQF